MPISNHAITNKQRRVLVQQIPRILCNTREVPHSYFSTTRCVVLHASLHVTSWRRIASPKPNKRYDISDTKKRSKRAKRALRMADKAAGRRLATLALHHHMMITNVTFLRRGKHIMSKELLMQWASCKDDLFKRELLTWFFKLIAIFSVLGNVNFCVKKLVLVTDLGTHWSLKQICAKLPLTQILNRQIPWLSTSFIRSTSPRLNRVGDLTSWAILRHMHVIFACPPLPAN